MSLDLQGPAASLDWLLAKLAQSPELSHLSCWALRCIWNLMWLEGREEGIRPL